MIPASLDYSTPQDVMGIWGREDHDTRIELTSKDRARPINGASSAPGPGSSASNSAGASANDSGSSDEKDAQGWRMFLEIMNGVAKAADQERERKQREAVAVAATLAAANGAEANRAPSAPPPEPVMDQDVERVVQVCVPMSLLDLGWGSSAPNSKMMAFKTATKTVIRELSAGTPVNDSTQFRIMDKFNVFDPGTTDSRSLVAMVNWGGTGVHDCPADNHPYTLDVMTRGRGTGG
jgi:hypothetical protein